MFKFVVVALTALIACVAAKPGVVAPLAYANAPLYAAGGSSQVDIRNNYDGTLSSYATAPFGYAGPVASRYVSGVPAAYAAAPAFAAPAPVVARYASAAPVATAFAAAAYTAPFAGPYSAPFAAPYTAPFAAPYAAPFAAPYAAPYAAPFGAQYAAPAVAAPAPVVF